MVTKRRRVPIAVSYYESSVPGVALKGQACEGPYKHLVTLEKDCEHGMSGV